MKNRLNPSLSLIICSCLWSTGGLLIKLVDYNGMAIGGVRSLIALIFLSLVTRRFPVPVAHDKNGKFDSKATFFLIAGGLCYALTMILFVAANKMTTAANAILLQYTSIIYVIALGPLLLGEKNSFIDYAAASLIIVGMIILVGGDLRGGSLAGNITALLSGTSFGLTTIFLRKQKNADPVDSLNLSNLIGFIICIPAIAVSGVPSVLSITGLLLLGVVQIGLPCIFWAYGIKRVNAANCVVLTMCEPVLNPVWVALVVHELPSFTTVAGGIVILISIIAHVFIKNSSKVQKAPEKLAV